MATLYVLDARSRLRLSRAALARVIRVASRTVARWEVGETRPRQDHLSAIAQLLLSRGGPVDLRELMVARGESGGTPKTATPPGLDRRGGAGHPEVVLRRNATKARAIA